MDEEAILWDGFDTAIIGTSQGWNGGELIERICYDGNKMTDILMDQGMSLIEAEEFIQFNVIGGYVGEFTPNILWSATFEELLGSK